MQHQFPTTEASSSRVTDMQQQSIADHVDNTSREAAILTQSLTSHEKQRPINTTKAYLSKQKLFEKFCSDCRYENGTAVTEAKLLRFLDEVVVPRGNIRKRRTDSGEAHQLSKETILQYIKAIVDLHASQASRSLVSGPGPRGTALKAWLKSKRFRERRKSHQGNQNCATLSICQDTQVPAHIQLQQVVPEISRQLQNLNAKMDRQHAILQAFLVERQRDQLNIVDAVNGLRKDMQALSEACSSLASGSRVQPRHPPVIAASTVSNTNPAAPTESYTLNRHIASVVDLWREWSVGLQPNMPAVQEMNQKYGTSWRKDAKERQFYSRRLTIINELYSMAKTNDFSLDEAANILERTRVAEKWSLSRLSNELRK